MNEKDPKKKKIPKPRRSKTMFQCGYCGRQFRTTAALVRHVFKKHPIPPDK